MGEMCEMKEFLTSIFLGLLIIILGFIVSATLGSIFDGGNPNNSFLSAIMFAILFLCSTITVCTRAMIKAFKAKN